MIKVILSGCNGHMGQVLTDILNADSETVVVAGIDIAPGVIKIEKDDDD